MWRYTLQKMSGQCKHDVTNKQRWINETLYKSDSAAAHELMSNDPAVFADVRPRSLSTFCPR